jgi:putative hydrolase of the HAD superfamily
VVAPDVHSSQMSAKAVVFDLFGTLIDDSPPAGYAQYMAETARLLGTDPDRLHVVWETHDVARYTTPIEECFQAVCTELGVADYRPALAFRVERMRGLLVPRPDAVATLEELRRRGLKLGMISNASSELSGLWAESAFAPHFDAVLFSADERMMKPDRRLYERMAELLGVTTQDCVFVGDGAYRELQGAEAAGMTAVHIRAPYDEWEHEGAVGWTGPRVSSLSEVLALV